MAIATTYTYQDIMDHLAGMWDRDSAIPTPRFVMRLCDQALREITQECKPFKKTWTGAATSGDSSLLAINVSSKVYQFYVPIDLINVISVMYSNGSNYTPLQAWTHETLDRVNPDWQNPLTSTGLPFAYCIDGNVLELDCPIPIGDVAKILVHGYCYLPPMSVTETTSTTPLQYIPITNQLALVDYILAKVPIRKDSIELDMMNRQTHQQEWDLARKQIVQYLGSRDAQWATGE